MNEQGTILMRKAKGRKLQFVMGGPTLEEAQRYINWKNAAGMVFEFVTTDARCSVVPRVRA